MEVALEPTSGANGVLTTYTVLNTLSILHEAETGVPRVEREKFMSELARGGHAIVRHSLGREPSLRNLSTYFNATEFRKRSAEKRFCS